MNEKAVNLILAASTGSEVDALLARYGFPVPRAETCPHQNGHQIGLHCYYCNGGGSTLHVGTQYFPNDERGYVEAAKAMVRLMKKDEASGR